MAKEWASLDEKQVGGKEGARSSPAEGKERARRGQERVGGGKRLVAFGSKWASGKWEPCGETVGEGWGVAVLRLAK